MFSCKKEVQDVSPVVNLNFFVIDDLQQFISNATVYIYDSEASYQSALGGNYAGFIDSINSSSAGNTISLAPGKEYWVIINYKDLARSLDLTNVGISSKIDKLEKSDITLNFYISPKSGFVSFWKTFSNKGQINIKVNNGSYTLDSSKTIAPTTYGDLAALNISLLPGTYSYYAVSLASGCVWNGTFTVQRGVFQTIELNPCIRGRVTFVASTFNSLHDSIAVTLNGNDFLGYINSSSSYTCGSSSSAEQPGSGFGSYITVTRDLNNYTYVARSKDGSCSWTGSFSINSDTCFVIDLPVCP